MPKSKPPRHARGVPQHRRDLQTMEKPMSEVAALRLHGSSKKMLAFGAGGIVGGAVVGEAGGRKLGEQRHAKGKGRPNPLLRYGSYDRGWKNADSRSKVGKGLVSIPARHVSPGGAAGIKRLKGAAEEAAASTWKRKIGETPGRVAKEGRRSPRELAYDAKHHGSQFKAGVRRGSEVSLELSSHASRARRAGFKVGQGRKGIAAGIGGLALGEAHGRMSKSLPEATAVRRVTPRTQSGRYVSHENDLLYIQPRSFGSRRPTRDSKLQVWHKKGKSAVGKASFRVGATGARVARGAPFDGLKAPDEVASGLHAYGQRTSRKYGVAAGRARAGMLSSAPSIRDAGRSPGMRRLEQANAGVGKASVLEAPLPTLADTAAFTGARRGRRDNVLKSVAGAAESGFKRTAGDLYDRMARKEITHTQYATGHDNARNAFHIQTGQATPAPHIKVLPKMPKRHVTLPTGPRLGRKLAAPPDL